MFVVNASMAVAWCFDDELSDIADRVLARLEEEQPLAPAIWPLEVANGMRTAERRGRLKAGELPRIRELLGGLSVQIEMVELTSALGEVLEMARSLELTAYDAAYLALASRRHLAFDTIDDGFKKACRRAGRRAGVLTVSRPQSNA